MKLGKGMGMAAATRKINPFLWIFHRHCTGNPATRSQHSRRCIWFVHWTR